jgi:hypothetical protein
LADCRRLAIHGSPLVCGQTQPLPSFGNCTGTDQHDFFTGGAQRGNLLRPVRNGPLIQPLPSLVTSDDQLNNDAFRLLYHCTHCSPVMILLYSETPINY